MAERNVTGIVEFVLLGFTESPHLQLALFVLFFLIYLVTVVGNLWLILLIGSSSQLHSPKYFFLGHLAFLDFCYSSVCIPKLLVNLLTERKVISYTGCILQFSLFSMFLTTECFLLAAMAYDRYMAICKPLRYGVTMTAGLCLRLVAGSYVFGCVTSLTHMGSLLRWSICGPNIINHYFCDIPVLIHLACSNVQRNEILLLTFSGVISVSTFMIVISSYFSILITILKIPCPQGRYKSFSTCASHLTVVTLFYATVIFTYLCSSFAHPSDWVKIISVFYTLLLPVLNLLIYSIRNKEAKEALRKMLQRKILAQ
ncbi:olfactory receptor 1052-like [Dromiciops gliroides]|uniref:olfactory receptor 1052-like n=1 Tax=Dromiciops gliroides TaxID=33562 RepID=UPI001CC60E19|nr:olfactory receptor 1052-like [Dromiciops gliroides]